MDKIYKIYKRFTDEGCRCDFTVIVSRENLVENQKKYPGICFKTSRISYSTVLRKIASTRCILELCAEGQDGLTMRFYESVFYNKLLITNNQTAKLSNLFNSRYMQIINIPEDIDIQLVKTVEDITYEYHDENSPKKLMEAIKYSA